MQSLKYFINQKDKIDRIPEILDYITEVDTLSPLLVLNILAKNGEIPFEFVAEYFYNKLEDKAETINRNKEIMMENMVSIKKAKDEYKELKTKAKVF